MKKPKVRSELRKAFSACLPGALASAEARGSKGAFEATATWLLRHNFPCAGRLLLAPRLVETLRKALWGSPLKKQTGCLPSFASFFFGGGLSLPSFAFGFCLGWGVVRSEGLTQKGVGLLSRRVFLLAAAPWGIDSYIYIYICEKWDLRSEVFQHFGLSQFPRDSVGHDPVSYGAGRCCT